MDIIGHYTGIKEPHLILNLYTRGISYSAIMIIPKIQNCWDKNNKTEKFKFTKKTFLHFFLLYLNSILFIIVVNLIKLIINRASNKSDFDNFNASHYSGLCTEESINIIVVIIISFFLLNTRLYIHHIIGLIIFIVFSFSIDILHEISILKPGLLFLFVYLVYIFVDTFYITYQKYMMDKLYYSPYHIVFSLGLLMLIITTGFVILILIKGDMKFYEIDVPSFSNYFKQNNYLKEIIILYITQF
jgi:hypothetical protein